MEKGHHVNKAILVGIGVGIAVIVIAGISATLVTQEQPGTNEITLEDQVEMKIEKAEEALEPAGGTQYNFTVKETINLGSP